MNSVLILFIKNPAIGKVKTRLAKSIGEKKALGVYRELLKKTVKIASHINLNCKKEVWYSDYINEKDQIDINTFDKKLQRGKHLGERMSDSFRLAFKNGFEKAVIIGSDCPELTSDTIESAFGLLDDNDMVIGPSFDGGYYLLGLNKYHPDLFSEIEWSSNKVLSSTIQKAENLNLKVSQLPVLNDIDTIEDLRNSSISNLLEG